MKIKDLTSEHIIRNINISILIDSELKEPYNTIYEELKKVFSDLNIYTTDSCPKHIYYGKSKKSKDVYIDYDSKNELFWANEWDALSFLLSLYKSNW